jgi:type IV secretion system protein VirD4
MYKLARLMFMFGSLLLVYSIVVVCAMAGMWGWVVLALIGLAVFKRKGKALWAHGTAAWSTPMELWLAGLLGAGRGLIIGRVAGWRGDNPVQKMTTLFKASVPPKEACERFMAKKKRKDGGDVVRLADAVHTAVFAPTGVGKGVSCVVPFLLTSRESCVVVDYKGELAKITGKHRRRFGKVVMLDPWRLVTEHPDTLNPLDFMENSPAAVDKCNALANALVIRTKQDMHPHFNDRAEAWIAAGIAATVYFGKKELGTRSLQKVADMMSSPQQLEIVMKGMQDTDAWDGVLARMGGQMAHSKGEELGSILSTVSRFTRFLNTPAVIESTKSSRFNPSELRNGGRACTAYLIIPAKDMNAQAGLMRLWLVTLMSAVVEGGLQ